MCYDLATHDKEYGLGIRYNATESQFLWNNGNAEGLHSSSDWWYEQGSQIEPNGSGDCVNSFGKSKNFLLRDIGCNNYDASYVCEKL